MPVIHDRARRITAVPPTPARSQTQVRVVAVRKELLVEESHIIEHLPAVKRSATVGKKGFLVAVVLAGIRFPSAAAAIESVRVEEMPYLIDEMTPIVE